MRGTTVRSSFFARRIRPATNQTTPVPVVRKAWPLRLWHKTAAPFWVARLRRHLRQLYRDTVAWRMFITSRAFYRVEIRGLENYSYTPSTIIACGHKRDMDLPIVIPRLFNRKGSTNHPASRNAFKLMYVAARDDVFEAGFLMIYFPMLDFLRPVLGRISIERLFKRIQACPVKLPDEQTVNQLLHETKRLEGNLPVEKALDLEWQTRLLGKKAHRSGLTLNDVIYSAPLKVLSQYATPRMFREPLASRIRHRHYNTTVQQLHYITRILEKGGTLLVLPEGRVTPDGRFCKMRAAVTRLVLQTRVESKLLPVNLTYDFLDTIRPSVTMLVGPEIANLKTLTKNELTELIRHRVASLTCVTFSGLVSRELIRAVQAGEISLDIEQLRAEIWQEVQRLTRLGLPLDRQLTSRRSFDQRFERFLVYGRSQKEFLYPAATGSPNLYLNRELLLRQDCQKHTDNPVRYCYNELTELLENYQAIPSGLTATESNISDFALSLAEISVSRTAG